MDKWLVGILLIAASSAVSAHAQPQKVAEAICPTQCGSKITMQSKPHAAVLAQPGGGTIVRVDTDTGVTSTFETNRTIKQLVAASDGTLYYTYKTVGTNDQLVAVAANNAQTQIFDSVGPIRKFLVDATSIFFVDDRGLRKQPRAGGAQQQLVTAANIALLLGVDSASVYFTSTGSQLRKIQLDGTNNLLMGTFPGTTFSKFAQDSNNVYFGLSIDFVARVSKAHPFGTGTFVLGARVYEIAAKDGVLYYIKQPTAGVPTLELRRTSGALPGSLIDGPSPYISSLVTVGDRLYWLRQSKAGDPTNMVRY
jgi:hypothetical protein